MSRSRLVHHLSNRSRTLSRRIFAGENYTRFETRPNLRLSYFFLFLVECWSNGGKFQGRATISSQRHPTSCGVPGRQEKKKRTRRFGKGSGFEARMNDGTCYVSSSPFGRAARRRLAAQGVTIPRSLFAPRPVFSFRRDGTSEDSTCPRTKVGPD